MAATAKWEAARKAAVRPSPPSASPEAFERRERIERWKDRAAGAVCAVVFWFCLPETYHAVTPVWGLQFRIIGAVFLSFLDASVVAVLVRLMLG